MLMSLMNLTPQSLLRTLTYLLCLFSLVSCTKSELQLCIEAETRKTFAAKNLNAAFENIDNDLESLKSNQGAIPDSEEEWEEWDKSHPSFKNIRLAASAINIGGRNSDIYQLVDQTVPMTREDKMMGVYLTPYQSVFDAIQERTIRLAVDDHEELIETDFEAFLVNMTYTRMALTAKYAESILQELYQPSAEDLCNSRGVYK